MNISKNITLQILDIFLQMKKEMPYDELPEYLKHQTDEQIINSVSDKLTEEEKEYFRLKYEIFQPRPTIL